MEFILNWIRENFVNGLISLLIFACCVVLGAFASLIIFRFLKNGKQKQRKITTANIEPFVNEVVDDFSNEKVKLGKEKLTQLLAVASELLEEIPKNYQKKVKYCQILKKEDFSFLERDIKISLNFSVCEGLRFLRATVSSLQEEIYIILDSGAVKAVYGVGKVVNFFTKTATLPKNPEDFLISEVFEIIDKVSNPNIKIKKQLCENKKEKGLIKKGLEKVGGKVADVGISALSSITDKYLKDFIREFAGLINLLYSDGFKDEKQTGTPQSTSIKEIA